MKDKYWKKIKKLTTKPNVAQSSRHNNLPNMVIYKAIFGQKDDLKSIAFKTPNCDYYCFTDNLYNADWKIIKEEVPFLINKSPRFKARYFKVNSHLVFPQYKYSLWIDGQINLTSNIHELISLASSNHDIAMPKHPERSCIYAEAAACKALGKDNKVIIDKQIQRYEEDGFPKNMGLCASGIILRKHTKRIKEFNETWWNEILNGSIRDQISLNYVLYKLNINWYELPSPWRKNKWYKLGKHRK